LSELTRKVLFLSVHTGSAAKTLSDGRNAHLIQRPPEWWLSEHLLSRFKLFEFRRNPSGFAAVLEARDEG
jgi:hypothetical protein